MDICERCEDMGCVDCMHCRWGNPCLDCLDYDEKTNACTSNGGCGKEDLPFDPDVDDEDPE